MTTFGPLDVTAPVDERITDVVTVSVDIADSS